MGVAGLISPLEQEAHMLTCKRAIGKGSQRLNGDPVGQELGDEVLDALCDDGRTLRHSLHQGFLIAAVEGGEGKSEMWLHCIASSKKQAEPADVPLPIKDHFKYLGALLNKHLKLRDAGEHVQPCTAK
eukprot:1148252-Pelagomonas_calceolata.AAC.3